jgi:hypothetical protein
MFNVFVVAVVLFLTAITPKPTMGDRGEDYEPEDELFI